MKTRIVILSLVTILSVSCKSEANTKPQATTEDLLPSVTSIDALKNGVPYINYLGIKVEGC